MAEHILITRASRGPHSRRWTPPEGAEYAAARGLWLQNGAPLITTTAGRPGTKKANFEPSSEDMKDE